MTKTWTLSKIIAVAKATKQIVMVDGETFYFAPVGCDESQVEALSAKGFHLLADPLYDRGVGLCWRKGR